MTECTGTTHYEGCPCHEARRDAELEAVKAKADRLARLLQGFTIFDWRTELKGSQLHPEDVDRIELDALEAKLALADYRGEGKP